MNNHLSRTRFLIILAVIFMCATTSAQDKIYLWHEIEPGWKTRSLQFWENAKGYGKSVPSLMSTSIKEHYSIASKKFELSLKDQFLDSDLAGIIQFTDNPGKERLNKNDLYIDLQCWILEVSDDYPYMRTSKIRIEPVIIYNMNVYDSKGDLLDNMQFADEIDYKVLIRPTLRGLPEHKRDIEIVRQSFIESFSGNTIDKYIQKLEEIYQVHNTEEVHSDPAKVTQVLALLFDNRRLRYPEDYQNIEFERQTTPNSIEAESIVPQIISDDNPAITGRLAELIKGSRYYALLIGVNEYLDPRMNDLTEPLNDVQKFYNTLTSKYLFSDEDVIVLKDPTRDKLIETFDLLAREVTSNDNLLVFYAGHGLWDEQLKKGYWMASDASSSNRANWFSNSDLRDYIGGIKAKHTLLISDACFSGGIFKTREAFTGATPATLELYRLPSRKAMTSGAMTTVPDKSVFIEYLIKRLEDNSNYFLSSEQLFASFKIAVINNSATNQVPQFGEIRETGDEGGDFLFIRKDK